MEKNIANHEEISVSIRMRPMNEREINANQEKIFACQTASNSVQQVSKGEQPVENQTYYFDKVFDCDTTTTEVYNSIAKDIVKDVVKGINGTIFAYGQTSSGKTHTMVGKLDSGGSQRGILEMAAIDILNLIAETADRDFLVRVSFVEIYNENIRDLLSDAADSSVAIREDPRKGVYCEASEVVITDFESIMRSLKRGISKRTVEATAMNDTSSRSHTIFKVVIESKQSVLEGQDSDGAILVASLNLVDLAGSESARHTGATGQRAKEGGKINQSLLSLSRVIHSLSQPGTHVNYRDSKLTRLLQPSLSGNAKMAIVCCITPADKYLEETRSTLQFASRAKLVTTHATVNEVLDDSVKLKRLQRELNALKDKQKSVGLSEEEAQRMEAEKENLHSQLAALVEEKELQRIQLEHLKHLVVIGGADNEDVGVDIKRPKKRVRDTWCPGLLVAQKDSTDADGMSRFRSTGSSKSIQSSDIAYNQTEHGRTRHSEGSNGHDVEDDNDRTFVVDTEMLDQLELANNTIVQLQEELEFLRSNPTIDSVNSSEFERIKVERDAAVEQLEIEMGANAESEASWRRLIDELKQENIALEEKLSQELNKTSHLSESEEELISIRQQLEQAKSLFEEANSLSETLRCQVETMQQESKDLTEKVAVLEEDSSTLRSQVATFEEDKITLLASIDSLNKELETVQTNQASTSATEEELEAKVANQHEMLVFAKSTIEDLTAQVTELEAEVATKSTLITDLESRITEKDNQIATDAETIRSLEEKVEGNEAGIAEMERNMQDFFTIVNDSKAREEMIELKLNEEEEKTLELADQVLRLEKQFEGAINDLTAEKMISTQLKGDVNNATIVVQNYEKELSTVSEQLLLSTEKVTGLESKVTDLSQQLASVKDAASHTDNSELAKKDKQLQQMNSEIGGKDGEISRLMKTLQDVQTRCEVAEQELDKSRVRENQVCGDEESMKKRVGQLQTTVDLLKSEKDSLVRKLAESEAALETLYNESCNEKEKMTAHAEAQAKQLAKLQVDLSNASQSISAASALEIKLAAARAEKAVVDEDLKRLSQMAHDLQMSVNDSANASALRDDNDRLRSTATEVGDALTEANQRFKKAKDEAVMLKNELDRVEAEAKSINANLSAAKAERNEFMAELEKALMQVQELTEALVEAENLKSESTADSVQIKELEEKMLKLVADVEAKERVIESFKEEIQELKDATMILPSLDSDELDTIKQEKQDVEQKCETVLAECAELKSVVKKYANMLQRGQEALQDSFDDNELLKTRVSELEEKLEEINKKFKVAAEKETLLVEQYDLLSNELKVKEQALQRVQSEASKSKYVSDQVLASTDKVEAAQDHIEQLREERDSMSAEYTQMRNELRSIKQQYELAESALESARRELIEVVDTKDKRIAHLEKHKLTKEHLEMINKLKDERKKYQEDCKTMKRQLSDLKRAYETLRDSAVTPSENNKAATSRSSKAKADGSEDEQSKDVASLESELIIAKGELDASHTLVLSLRNKLRDCSKQLQEYESERTGIIDVLERNGIDTAGLIYDSKSTSDNEADIGSASLLEADLVDAVSKLAEKLIAAKATIAQIEQKRATTLLSNNERLKELEDSLLHVQAELTETRAQRNVLEKRVETHKSAVRASREEVASLTIDIESVRQAMIVAQEELTEAKSKITNMRMSAPTATDAMAPEIQALEEENIELLKENKDLRKSVATLKAQAEKTAKISEFSQPRQFGTDLGKRILSVDNIMKPTVNETSVTKAADTSDVQQKRIRNRKMSVAGGDENAPGECAQS